MFGLSLFRPSRQSNISKIQISPPLGEQDHSNALPQGTIKSPPDALRLPSPPPPLPHPAGITLIGTLSREGPVTRTAPISRG